MTTPDIVRFPDGHFRKVVYGLGPYIADYPEQCLLASTLQGWCPKYIFLRMKYTATDEIFFRCTAPWNDLDSKQHVRRSKAHTELLTESFDLRTLWNEYGLVADVIVRVIPLYDDHP